MIQVPQHLSNNRRRGGCCYLVMLLIVGGLLGRITTGEALAQSPTPHSLQLDAVAASLVWVEVDGVVRFHGTMQPQERRVWQGTVLRLTIATESPATVRYDGTISTTVGDAGKIITVQWPTPEEPVDSREPRDPQLYRVQPNDTLYKIATQFGTDIATLQVANQLLNSDLIYVGTVLAIPGSDGTLPEKAITAQFIPMATDDAGGTPVLPQVRGTVTERLTVAAQEAAASSPFYRTTWLTYYGRPAVPVMGILGEHELDELIPRLKAEAAAYDLANGDDLAVRPALHLVYGMATKAPNDDNSHLIFLEDAKVEEYITRAQEEEFAVILDIQIGALTPATALSYGLPWLAYDNVHLALDPEFAMAHAGQRWPGDPIGYVTAAQINEAQALMQEYIEKNDVAGQRVLLVHQFLDTMIEDKTDLDWSYPNIVLTLSADGWGGPWGKISKYNSFMDEQTRFTAFKLFYRWDEPLMTPKEALGIDGYGEGAFIEVTPNLVIYQ